MYVRYEWSRIERRSRIRLLSIRSNAKMNTGKKNTEINSSGNRGLRTVGIYVRIP